MAHAPLLLLAAAHGGGEPADPLKGGGAWAWPIAFAVHALVLRLAAPGWPEPVARAVHACGLLAWPCSARLLGRAVTADWGAPDSAWPWLGWLVVPAALLLLLTRRSIAGVWPVRAAPAAYAEIGGAVLAAGLWLWTLIANIASDGTAAPLPHLPLVNPLDVGVALALVAVLLWLRTADQARGPLARRGRGGRLRLAQRDPGARLPPLRRRAVSRRRLDRFARGADRHHAALVGDRAGGDVVRRAPRRARAVDGRRGAARGGGAKLLLVDLAGTGTVTRIVSFIGVGVLMLVIGYVAPLPAKEARHASA